MSKKVNPNPNPTTKPQGGGDKIGGNSMPRVQYTPKPPKPSPKN